VWNKEDLAVAAGHSVAAGGDPEVDPERWQSELDDVVTRIGSRFARVEPRRRARAFLSGLMAELPRRNCWSIAEHAGDRGPDGMQRLLNTAVWDADAVRDDLRKYVVEHLGDPAAVAVIDETGDLKKGTKTVGAQRQYCGTAGRVENCQVAVYLTYAAPKGYAFIDRALYLPKSWTNDPDRCAAAGVPTDTEFATKPSLARLMIERALDAAVPVAAVTGDEVYGADPTLRAALVARRMPYVLAVAKDHPITTGIGTRRAIDLAVRLPRRAWQRLSAGKGSKGERWYDWALIDTTDPATDPKADPAVDSDAGQVGCHWLLIRRNIRTGELAFYRAYSPTPVRMAALVKIAGTRWRIEESFQSGKELSALDEHQVRRWTSWKRWTVLAMLAHAVLSVLAATTPPPDPATGLIPLTRNEIRRLLAAATAPIHRARHALHWSTWRRQHQARARASHYRRRGDDIT
jgi:SRSO17 transposase